MYSDNDKYEKIQIENAQEETKNEENQNYKVEKVEYKKQNFLNEEYSFNHKNNDKYKFSQNFKFSKKNLIISIINMKKKLNIIIIFFLFYINIFLILYLFKFKKKIKNISINIQKLLKISNNSINKNMNISISLLMSIKEIFSKKGKININQVEATLFKGKPWFKNKYPYNEINVGFSLDPGYILRCMMTVASVIDSQKPETLIRLHFAVVRNFSPKNIMKIYSLISLY